MAVEYVRSHTSKMSDGFSQILREADETLKNDSIQMLGEGIREIFQDNTYFNQYQELLCRGIRTEEAEALGVLINNARTSILQESMSAGISPVASLAVPTLMKAWARVAIPRALPTEPVESPKFKITYMKPYIIGRDGVKRELPEGMRNENVATKQRITNNSVTLPLASAHNLFQGLTISAGNDSIDVDFHVVEVTIDDGTPVVVPVELRLDTRINTISATVTGGATTDTLFVRVDRKAGTLQAASFGGKIVSFKVDAYLSTEMNTSVEQVGFDIEDKEVHIGTGEHFGAPLPTEYLNDLLAMYKMDGAAKVVDIMSEVLAQKVDFDGKKFLNDAINLNPNAVKYSRSFSAKPVGSYTGSPTEWKAEIRTVINNLAITMKNDTPFPSGDFVILGNDLDVDLIPNVDWLFTNAVGEMNGVPVNYSIGAMVGNQSYRLVSSPNFDQGKLILFFIPSSPDYYTFKYYPYTFTVENGNGYRMPSSPNVPAVIVHKRHTFEKIVPMIGTITVTNNNGLSYT